MCEPLWPVIDLATALRPYKQGEVTLQLSVGGHVTISVLWGNTAYCAKFSGEDFVRVIRIKYCQSV